LKPFLLVTIAALSLANPALATDAPVERPISADERNHWSYKPLANPTVPADDSAQATHPVDQFLKAARDARATRPLPRASRSTLLRRVCFDLTGLPPSPEQAREFLDDNSPNAYAKLVDRLLASPAYGERWAQHWLDLARFAETDGFEHDLVRPNAWRYRDWVIGALNNDMPFDEFLSLQIAGDEMRPDDPEAAVATGFLLCGPDMPDLNLQDERRFVVLNEMTAAVGSVFLGLQFGCAQCHDHKYDPIRQHDFYRLRAFFDSAELFGDRPIPTAADLAARRAAEEAADPEDRRRRQRRDELEESGREKLRAKNPDLQPNLVQVVAELSKSEQKEHRELVKQLRDAPKLPELPLGRIVRPGSARPSHLFLRGDFRQQGPEIDCGFPAVLQPVGQSTESILSTEGRRVSLAHWLTQPDHPLVSRVIVNRVWQWHFGSGLAPSASDFGVMGGEPAHPELLDWLARQFVADGWRLKRLHRLLVTSEAYQSASGPFDPGWSSDQSLAAREIWKTSLAADPLNESIWHRRRARLDGEAIRDAMLSAAGRLSTRRGGPGIRPPLSPEVTGTLLKDQWLVNGDDEDHRRRSIYLFVRRNLRYPMFDVFDRPDTNASCPARHESTTATQSLTLLNSDFSLQCARWLAGAILREQSKEPTRQIEAAYLRLLGRQATGDELHVGQAFLERQQAMLRAEGRGNESLALPEADGLAIQDPFAAASLVDFCLALINANEFVYVD
jgi:hypothetical protein